MAITVTEASYEPKSISQGPVRFQFVEIVALSGATAGTCTATRLKELYHVIIPGMKSFTAAKSYATNVATLAFTVPAETASTLVQANVTYTATANRGVAGNSISITLIDGSGDDIPVTDGNEIVSVSGKDISIRIDPTSVTGSTKAHVASAIAASAAAAALVTATVAGGHTADVCPAHSKASLTGGVNGGFRGTAICIGR